MIGGQNDYVVLYLYNRSCICRADKAGIWSDRGNVSADTDNHGIHSAGRPVLPGILTEVADMIWIIAILVLPFAILYELLKLNK